MKKEISLRKVIETLSAYDSQMNDARILTIHESVVDGKMQYTFRIGDSDGVARTVMLPLYEGFNLTKDEAIKRHRMMWNWISYETLKRKRRVYKSEAIKHFGWDPRTIIADCWCCTYIRKNILLGCKNCPVVWPSKCCTHGGLYEEWSCTPPIDYEKAADLAYQIANLPEREDVE